MTSDDLRHLLKTVAAEGTDKVTVDEGGLLPRIQRRRRRRSAVTGLAGLAAAAVIAVGAYAVLPDQGTPGTEGVVAGPTKAPAPTEDPKCGGTIAASFPLGRALGWEGLQIPAQAFKTTPNGWGGSLPLKVADPREVDRIDDWIGATSTFVVTQKHVVVGSATVTVTKPVTSQTIAAHLDVRPCASPSPVAGQVDLYGQLFPGRHPITFFTVTLTPR